MEQENKALEKEEKILVPTQNELEGENVVVKYLRPDVEGGFLYGLDEVKYFQAVQVSDIVDNCMLGNFNGKGEYIVSPLIIDEIIKLKKVYVSAFDKSIYCETLKEFKGYGNINLRLTIKQNTPKSGTTTAVLELLETVNKVNGYYQNTNHIALLGAQFKGKDDTDKILKFFNIINPADGGDDGALKENDIDVTNIMNRIAYLDLLRQGHRKFMAKYQKDLYSKRINILSKSKIGTEILEDFNKEFFHINNKYTDKNNPEFYKHLNQLLDSIIERNIDFIKEDEKTYEALNKIQSASAALYNENFELLTTKMEQIKNNKKESVKEGVKENVVEKKEEEKKEEIKAEEKKEEVKQEAVKQKEKVKQPKQKVEKTKKASKKEEKHEEKEQETDEEIEDTFDGVKQLNKRIVVSKNNNENKEEEEQIL